MTTTTTREARATSGGRPSASPVVKRAACELCTATTAATHRVRRPADGIEWGSCAEHADPYRTRHGYKVTKLS